MKKGTEFRFEFLAPHWLRSRRCVITVPEQGPVKGGCLKNWLVMERMEIEVNGLLATAQQLPRDAIIRQTTSRALGCSANGFNPIAVTDLNARRERGEEYWQPAIAALPGVDKLA